MGVPDQFPSIDEARRRQREADSRTRTGIAVYLSARDAALHGAGSATAGSCAAHDLADGLGGPARGSAAAVAAARLGKCLRELGTAFDRIGEQFARLSDIARDAHLTDLRDRFGDVPDDYMRDLLGPDYLSPRGDNGHVDLDGGR